MSAQEGGTRLQKLLALIHGARRGLSPARTAGRGGRRGGVVGWGPGMRGRPSGRGSGASGCLVRARRTSWSSRDGRDVPAREGSAGRHAEICVSEVALVSRARGLASLRARSWLSIGRVGPSLPRAPRRPAGRGRRGRSASPPGGLRVRGVVLSVRGGLRAIWRSESACEVFLEGCAALASLARAPKGLASSSRASGAYAGCAGAELRVTLARRKTRGTRTIAPRRCSRRGPGGGLFASRAVPSRRRCPHARGSIAN